MQRQRVNERLKYFSDEEPHYGGLLLIQGHSVYQQCRDAFMVFNAYCSKLALLNHGGLSYWTPESPACVNAVYAEALSIIP